MSADAKKANHEPTAIEKLEAEIDRLKDALADALREKDHPFLDEANDIQQRLKERFEETQAHIEERPVQSALIALGIGFLIGRVLSR